MSTTREEASQLSIEDRLPHGPPITYGPATASPSAVNVFWSEKVKDDVALSGMRPGFLPAPEPEESDRGLEMVATDPRNLSALRVVGSDGTVVGAVDHAHGMTGFSHVDPSSQGGDLGMVLRMILVQNQELARQLVDLRKRVESGDQVSFPGSGVRGGTGAQGSGEQQGREKGRALEDLIKAMDTKETKDPGVAASPGEAPVVAGGEPSRGAPGKPVSRQLMEMARMRTGAGEMPASNLLSLSSSQIPNLAQVHGQTFGRSKPEGLRSEEINLGAALHQLLTGSVQPTPAQPIPINPLAFQSTPTNPVALQPVPIDPAASQPAPTHPGVFQPSPANPAGYQPIHQGGGIGIGESVGAGSGGPLLGGGLHQDAGLLPSWLKSFATNQESIRTVELAKLPEIKEGEMGSLVVGDWIALISPTMRDLSVSSSKWWDAVLRAATEAYSEWLRAEPLQKLYVVPRNPSLGERSLLLRQLVEGKQFSTVGEMVEHLRGWKRWLRRAVELQITIPDPTLLVGALEKMGATLTQHSSQASFRLSSARVLLQIDVNPTVHGVTSYADVLLAEAEAAFHSVTQQTTAKVKALEVGNQSKGGLTSGGTVGDVKKAAGVTATPTKQIRCKFFTSDEGCKKGAECTFKHDWGGVEKHGRCFNCGSTQHSKRDCPVKSRKGGDANKAVKAIAGDKTGGGSKGQDDAKGRSSEPAVASMKKEVKVEENTSAEKTPERVKKEEDPVKELLQETAGLLRSLRGPTLKKIMLNSLEVRDQRALLDGGATHCLRQAGSEAEWMSAKEVTVQLAQGSTVLRQKSWSRTLLTQDAVQPIVPLGVLVELCGYAVRWEGSSFELTDQSGRILDTTLEGGCPTVEEELGLELIKEIETAMIRQKARLNVLRCEDLSMDHEELVGAEMVEFLRLLKEVFLTTPEEVLERVPAKTTWKGEDLPWNRRKRRRLRCAKEIVLHLFSGGDPGFWEKELAAPGREVLCVDLAIHKDQDLRNDAIMAYLQYLCQLGTVAVVMGGPPCRSVSRLRHTQPGPPPLRSRFGPERFGLQHLEPWLQRRVNEDTNLWMRQLFLYMIAQRSATRLVAFVKESPQDPETYAPTPEGQEPVPSFWAFEEWRHFMEAYGIEEVSFDQGPMGHERRKPTTVGTNLVWLKELEGVRGPGRVAGSHGVSVEERILASQKWASWAPGLKRALMVALKHWLEVPRVQRMTKEEWKTHLLNDKGRYHRKIVSREALSLSIDLAGPFEKGIDQGAADKLGQARYFMAGTFTVPVTSEGKSLMIEEPAVEDAEVGEEALQEVEDEGGVREEVHDGRPDDGEEWLKKIEAEEDFEIRHLTLLEPLEDRKASNVVQAVARMVTKPKYLGLPVRRLHSDRAGELTATQLRRWCEDRGIYRTYTDGDGWKSNGRVEAEIAVLKRGIKTLLNSAELDVKYWPLAGRHYAERRWRMQLQSMNYPTDPLKVFGSKGWAKVKRWEERGNAWRLSRKPVRILGPDATMSPSSQGYYVMDESEKFFHSSDVVQGAEPPPLEDEVLPVLDEPGDRGAEDGGRPRRRLTGKSKPEEIFARRLQLEEEVTEGRELERGEFQRLGDMDEGWEVVYQTALELTQENLRLEEELRWLTKLETQQKEEDAACAALQEEAVLQTKTIPLPEVRKDLGRWKAAIEEEYRSLTQTGSLRPISAQEAEDLRQSAEQGGVPYDRLPGKAVFTKKAPSGKLKCRGVACGNFMASRPVSETYAGGIDATQVRSVLCSAVQRSWSIAGTDIKTAFLQVPAGRDKDVIIINPPSIFVESGVIGPEELWHVNGNIYGLTTSPRDWSDHRDHVLASFEWRTGDKRCWLQKSKEENLWRMKCQDQHQARTVGHLAVYIDDLLATGEDEVLRSFFDRVRQEWSISEPEWCEEGSTLRFCGLEVDRQGKNILLHQESYIRDLLHRYGTKGSSSMGTVAVPEEEETVSPQDVKTAQIATGELLWIATRSRPEISFPVALMCQYAVRRPRGVIRIGEEVRKYLNGTKGEGLLYQPLKAGDHGKTGLHQRERKCEAVEVYCDASFGSQEFKSTSGFTAFYAGCPVFWLTVRQPFIALSTAEAELLSLMDGTAATRGVASLVEELEEKKSEKRLFSDSSAAIAIVNGSSGSWRTRHLRLRASALTEAVRSKEILLQHYPGQFLVADGFTKQLSASLFRRFKEGLNLVGSAAQNVDGGVIKKLLRQDGERIEKAATALIAVGSLANVPRAAATKGESSEEGWDWFPIVLLGLAMFFIKVLEVIGREGLKMIKGREDVQVQRLSEQARMPERCEERGGGWCIYPCEEKVVNPGEHVLVKTGLRIKVPRSTHGRFSTGFELLRKGGEVGEGILSPEFGEEVKVLVRNSGLEPLRIHSETVIAYFQVLHVVQAEIKELPHFDANTKSPSLSSLRFSEDMSSVGKKEPPCLPFEKVWRGTSFRSMEHLISAKRSEFPEWLQHSEHLERVCRKPCTSSTDLWKCSDSAENRVVIREHRKERIKHYVSREEDVSNRPTMTFAWHLSGHFQVIYSHRPVATELRSQWTGFTVCEWGLSQGAAKKLVMQGTGGQQQDERMKTSENLSWKKKLWGYGFT
eukprot:s890_g33.t1